MGFVIVLFTSIALIEIALIISMVLTLKWQRKNIIEPMEQILNAVDNSAERKLKDLSKRLEQISKKYPQNIDVRIDVKPKEKEGEENNGVQR